MIDPASTVGTLSAFDPAFVDVLPSAIDPASVAGGLAALDLSPATLVGLGGAIGALLRYATTRVVADGTLPYGTLAVNVVGSFVLGLLTFGGAGGETALLVGVGACGSYTTFSSFAHDTVRLAETGNPGRGVANAVGTLLAALAAVGLAWLIVA